MKRGDQVYLAAWVSKEHMLNILAPMSLVRISDLKSPSNPMEVKTIGTNCPFFSGPFVYVVGPFSGYLKPCYLEIAKVLEA